MRVGSRPVRKDGRQMASGGEAGEFDAGADVEFAEDLAEVELDGVG
jgi:hypothetical protein